LDAPALEAAVGALIDEDRALRLGDGRLVARSAFDGLAQRMLDVLAAFHVASPLRYGMPREELKARALGGAPVRGAAEVADAVLAALRERAAILVLREKVRQASLGAVFAPRQEEAAARIETILLRERFAPPALAAIETEAGFSKGEAHDIMEALVDVGRVVKITPEMVFHRDLLAEVARAAREIIEARGVLAIADLKERLGVSRRYAMPLLEYLDRAGITRREGDARVAGARIDAGIAPQGGPHVG
jgi:selenocysteine-specific elongation factor